MTFTDKKPTVPGAYWWNPNNKENLLANIIDLDGMLFAEIDDELWTVSKMGGLWSSRLVPVEEVKEAYHEGVGSGAAAGRPLYVGKLWSASRARRVVEGKETT